MPLKKPLTKTTWMTCATLSKFQTLKLKVFTDISRFLMPSNFKVGEVITIIRKKLSMGREQGLFLLANGKHIMKPSAPLADIFQKC